MKNFPTIMAVLLATASVSACSMHHDHDTTAQAPTSMTQDFVTQASIGDMFEIKSSKLALKRSSDPKIRNLAQQMITDHMKSSANLKMTLAGTNASAHPATMLDAKHQQILDRLKTASKSDFNSMYLDDQDDAHDQAITLFETYASQGRNADVRNFATNTLPVLKMHKQHIENLEK